jgi:siroheme synthase-like protein
MPAPSPSAPLLPVFVKLEGRPCLIVGAGAIALQKITSLLDCGANVTVIAPAAREEVRAMAEQGRLHWIERPYSQQDITGQHLVIAATSDPDVNHAVYSDAVAAGVLANAVDDPPFCDFYFGSVVRRGPLQIGISTAGESPALAQRLRHQLEALLDDATGPWLERLGALRRAVLATRPPGEARNRLLRTLASRDLCDAATCPSRQLALHGNPEAHPQQQGSWWLT